MNKTEFLCYAIPAVIGTVVYAVTEFEKKKRVSFLKALAPHCDDIIAGRTVEVCGMALEKDTYLCTYEMCISLLVGSFKFHSRYVLPGTPRAVLLMLAYTACTFVFGWWSLHGIFWTPAIMLGNLSNSNRRRAITVAEEVQSSMLEQARKESRS